MGLRDPVSFMFYGFAQRTPKKEPFLLSFVVGTKARGGAEIGQEPAGRLRAFL